MKRLLPVLLALSCFPLCAMQMGASSGDEFREPFAANDGSIHFLRAARASEICEELNLSKTIVEDRQKRAEKGQFGIFFIEDKEGNREDTLFTGRMPLAVMPWNSGDSQTQERLEIIVKFYEWIFSLHGKTECKEPKVNDRTQVCTLFMNNSCHAATIVMKSAPYNTTEISEALARLTQSRRFMVPENADTLSGDAFVIISTGMEKPARDEQSPSGVFKMPYYAEEAGMRWVTVTSLENCIIPKELPEELQVQLQKYERCINVAQPK